LFSIISKAGLEKSEDFSRPALFLGTYVTASFKLIYLKISLMLKTFSRYIKYHNKVITEDTFHYESRYF
ncbi:hypothetical protein EFP30_09265, partial [Lactiplantibacillus pentosus]|uniref:hypothetical protein n=1 Tax=Lactiplantibacillus pentosus TaxID=1589 RepID=UPI0021A28B96